MNYWGVVRAGPGAKAGALSSGYAPPMNPPYSPLADHSSFMLWLAYCYKRFITRNAERFDYNIYETLRGGGYRLAFQRNDAGLLYRQQCCQAHDA